MAAAELVNNPEKRDDKPPTSSSSPKPEPPLRRRSPLERSVSTPVVGVGGGGGVPNSVKTREVPNLTAAEDARKGLTSLSDKPAPPPPQVWRTIVIIECFVLLVSTTVALL